VWWNGSCVVCSLRIDNCEYCLNLKCLKCFSNYILDQYGDCQPCSFYTLGCYSCAYQNLTTSSAVLNCTACLPNYFIYVYNNTSQCLQCNSTSAMTYCAVCRSVTICTNCTSIAFLNINSTCSLCSLYIEGCITCSSSSLCFSC
jgi:hypothetical protein